MESTQEYELYEQFKSGNTCIKVFIPKITEEERQRRIHSLELTIEAITGYKCKITMEE